MHFPDYLVDNVVILLAGVQPEIADAPHEDGIVYCERAEVDMLRHVGDEPCAVTAGELCDILPVKKNAAGFRRLEAEDRFEERGLARTVFAEQNADLSVIQLEVNAVEYGMPAVGKVQIVYLQHLPCSSLKKIIATKNGAPRSDVIAPTGRAAPLPMLRESVSDSRSNRLPQSADTGRVNL